MKNPKLIILWCIAVLIFMFPLEGYAEEYATFASFYKSSNSIGWLLAIIFAFIAGAVIYFTGGTASPIVTSIGTWIGNMMGLSGIAATNAGLALLGGGSLASGGLGIIGGVSVLTAALSFGTDIVIDFTAGYVKTKYQYSKFSEHSKFMTTIPIPLNDKGPKSYIAAIKILEDKISSKESIYSNYNQNIIKQALQTLNDTDDSTLFSNNIAIGEKSKKEALYSVLYFLLNEYKISKEHALASIISARKADKRRTLPAFIYAVSSLYEENYDFNRITKDYFRYSILAEPDNPIIPLLFSIYLDRMMYRFNDGFLTASSLQIISNIAMEDSIKDKISILCPIILSRYLIRLKIEQQKISSLALTENKTIKNSPKTLSTIISSLEEYETLLQGSNLLIENWLFGENDLDNEEKEKAHEFYSLLQLYYKDKARLSNLIDDLKGYQSILNYSGDHSNTLDKDVSQNNKLKNLFVFLVSCIVLLAIWKYKRRR